MTKQRRGSIMNAVERLRCAKLLKATEKQNGKLFGRESERWEYSNLDSFVAVSDFFQYNSSAICTKAHLFIAKCSASFVVIIDCTYIRVARRQPSALARRWQTQTMPSRWLELRKHRIINMDSTLSTFSHSMQFWVFSFAYPFYRCIIYILMESVYEREYVCRAHSARMPHTHTIASSRHACANKTPNKREIERMPLHETKWTRLSWENKAENCINGLAEAVVSNGKMT